MRIKYSLTTVALLAATAMTTAAWAGPNYNHAGVSLGLTEIDDGNADTDGDGIRVDGSFSPAPYLHVLGSFSSWDYDGSLERTDFTIGAGGHAPISPTTDLVGELFYLDREWESNGRDEDTDGLGLRAGVRTSAVPQLDLGGGLVHYELDDDDDTGIYGTAYFKFVPEIAAGAELELTDEQETLLLGGRYYF
ncbi:hypothetical protein H0Z60_11225 [Ectothiorhodospiraceae bacterium WFHF3C12]|nr:hypothetical protein [Ectothiorhodospiraceae bacterium WFHF3C12]